MAGGLLDTSSNNSSEAFRAWTDTSWLTELLRLVAPATSFAAFPPLRVFFPMAGGLPDTLVAAATTPGPFRTKRLGARRRPSKFALILSFVGDRLAALFPRGIPEPFAAFSTLAPTNVRTTFPSFELVTAIVIFYLNWLV